MNYLTDRGKRVLHLVSELEFQAEAYAYPPALPTDFELGFVNFTQARWLSLGGWLEYPDMEGPLRLTERGRALCS